MRLLAHFLPPLTTLVAVLLLSAAAPGHELRNLPHGIDHLDVLRAADFAAGQGDGSALVSGDNPGVGLEDHPSALPAGSFTTPVRTACFPFDQLVASWNVLLPTNTGLKVELRVGDGSAWSQWYTLNRQGAIPPDDRATLNDDWGRVDVDYLLLTRPAQAYQYRVQLWRSGPGPSPRLTLLAACYSAADAGKRRWKQLRPRVKNPPRREWARDLPVPFRSQYWEREQIRDLICSPTSLSMVLEYYGRKLPTAAVAEQCWNTDYRLFGSWPRAVETAVQFGLEGWVTRFRTWPQVKAEIAAGQPIIACIRYQEGELAGSPLNYSSGHLLVIRGLDREGNLLCDDPASPSPETGIITYAAKDMKRVWLDQGGVGLIIHPRELSQ